MDVPEMKMCKSFFKLYHLGPFITGTSKYTFPIKIESKLKYSL